MAEINVFKGLFSISFLKLSAFVCFVLIRGSVYLGSKSTLHEIPRITKQTEGTQENCVLRRQQVPPLEMTVPTLSLNLLSNNLEQRVLVKDPLQAVAKVTGWPRTSTRFGLVDSRPFT